MRVAGQGPGWHFDPRRHPRGVFAALPIEASDTHNAAVASPGARPMHTLYYSPGAASMVVHWLLIELAIPHQLSLVDFESRAQKSQAYRSEEHTSELQSLMRISYAVFCLKKK